MGCNLDKEKEGHFKSINDGKVMSQELSWYGDNPNQGTEANFVQLNKQYKSLLDTSKDREACTVCEVNKSTKISLWGACKKSFFGKGSFQKVSAKNIWNFPYVG